MRQAGEVGQSPKAPCGWLAVQAASPREATQEKTVNTATLTVDLRGPGRTPPPGTHVNTMRVSTRGLGTQGRGPWGADGRGGGWGIWAESRGRLGFLGVREAEKAEKGAEDCIFLTSRPLPSPPPPRPSRETRSRPGQGRRARVRALG